MNIEVFRRVEALVNELLAMGQRERERRLAELATDSPELHRRVEALVEVDGRLNEDFLAKPPAVTGDGGPADPSAELPPAPEALGR